MARFGSAPPKAYLGCFCGFDESNANSAGFLDLTKVDVEKFVDADDDALAKAVSASPKIIRAIAINKAPNLFYAEDVEPHHIESALMVAERADFMQRVGKALANRYADDGDEDIPVEKQIYNGFYSSADKSLLEEFQSSDWVKRRSLIPLFQDDRLKQLGRRLLVQENPENSSDETRRMFSEYLIEKWNTPKSEKPKWTTFESAESDLARAERDGICSTALLSEIREYFEDMKRNQ